MVVWSVRECKLDYWKVLIRKEEGSRNSLCQYSTYIPCIKVIWEGKGLRAKNQFGKVVPEHLEYVASSSTGGHNPMEKWFQPSKLGVKDSLRTYWTFKFRPWRKSELQLQVHFLTNSYNGRGTRKFQCSSEGFLRHFVSCFKIDQLKLT